MKDKQKRGLQSCCGDQCETSGSKVKGGLRSFHGNGTFSVIIIKKLYTLAIFLSHLFLPNIKTTGTFYET